MPLQAFQKFMPAEEPGKTVIHVNNSPDTLVVDHSYDKCQAALFKYNQGAMIQDAFPFLTPDEREFMMTGLTPEQWDKMFA